MIWSLRRRQLRSNIKVLKNISSSSKSALSGHENTFNLETLSIRMVTRFVEVTNSGKSRSEKSLNLSSVSNKSTRAWEYVAHDASPTSCCPGGTAVERRFFSIDEAQRILAAAPEPYFTERLQEFRVGYVLDVLYCPVTPETTAALENAIQKLERAGATLKRSWPEGVRLEELNQNYRFHLDAFTFSVETPEQQAGERKEAAASGKAMPAGDLRRLAATKLPGCDIVRSGKVLQQGRCVPLTRRFHHGVW
jgi:hypothetical protein